MIIEKVSYSELMPTGSFTNCRIEISGTVSQGETTLEALTKAKQLVTEFHRSAFPFIYELPNEYQGEQAATNPAKKVAKVNPEKERLLKLINNSQEKSELLSYQLMAKTFKVMGVFNKKLKQLSK